MSKNKLRTEALRRLETTIGRVKKGPGSKVAAAALALFLLGGAALGVSAASGGPGFTAGVRSALSDADSFTSDSEVLGVVTGVDCDAGTISIDGLKIVLSDGTEWEDGLTCEDITLGMLIEVHTIDEDGTLVAREVELEDADDDEADEPDDADEDDADDADDADEPDDADEDDDPDVQGDEGDHDPVDGCNDNSSDSSGNDKSGHTVPHDSDDDHDSGEGCDSHGNDHGDNSGPGNAHDDEDDEGDNSGPGNAHHDEDDEGDIDDDDEDEDEDDDHDSDDDDDEDDDDD